MTNLSLSHLFLYFFLSCALFLFHFCFFFTHFHLHSHAVFWWTFGILSLSHSLSLFSFMKARLSLHPPTHTFVSFNRGLRSSNSSSTLIEATPSRMNALCSWPLTNAPINTPPIQTNTPLTHTHQWQWPTWPLTRLCRICVWSWTCHHGLKNL